MERTEFDVVIIGGGHNALTCAAYLGRAGVDVCVLPAAPSARSRAMVSASFTPESAAWWVPQP